MPVPARRRTAAALAGLAVAAATSVTGTATAVAAGGAMTPAIGAHPHYQVAGRAEPNATTFSCQKTTPAGCYGPTQIRAAYGVDKLAAKYGANGSGQTIVIVDAYSSPTIQHDLGTFNNLFGLPSSTLNVIAPDGLTPFDQNDPNQVGWAGEITLDVEYAHAIAPAATIDLVLAKSNQDADILSATKYAVNNNLGNVISQSFGEAEQCMDPQLLSDQNDVFAAAAAKKITLLASAGDQGSAQPTCDGTSYFKAASSPATDPNVTAVGGTILDADGTTGAYHGETTWNEPTYSSAGGGGTSVVYKTPAYQKSLGLGKYRTVPDISYNAAIIGGVLAPWSSSGQGADLVFRFGGTSAGSPQWAGLVALADQIGHIKIGQMNTDLYALAKSKKYGMPFNDVTTGDNTYHGAVTVPGYPAGPGYDLATGLGTPKADLLVPLLANLI